MPTSRKSNHMMLLAAGAIASYWVLPFVMSGTALQSIFNSLVFGVATAIVITWLPSAVFALRRDVTGANQNIIGIFTLWLIVWLQRLYAIAFVVLDRPWWLLISALPAFLAYLFGIVGILFLWAPATMEETPKSFYWHLAISGILGTVFAAVSYYLQLQGI